MVYQDDILIATNSVDEHILLLGKVLTIFKSEGVQVNTEKSKLLVQKVNFLGHIIENGTFSPSQENMEAMKILDPPKTMKQLRSFLGKINFYAKFLPAVSHRAAPLTDILSNGKKTLDWTCKHSEVFEEIKQMLCCKPILHYPNFGKKFIVSIQVSDSALVGALEQEGKEGRIPIGYFSKKLSRAQKNYPILEKSALAVISVLDHFRHIILGYEVEVCTNRKAVEYLRSLKDGNTRVSDWVTKISAYAPLFTFNKDSSAITHILEISEAGITDTEEDSTDIPTAYTDGSCSYNGQVNASSGIGVHWQHCELSDYSGSVETCNTNNKAELAAILQALKMAIAAHIAKVVVVSDSKYAIDNILENMPEWKRNGWKNAKGKEIENISDFICIDHLMALIAVDWRHTPGHNGVPGNEKAHDLAMKGRLSVKDTDSKDRPTEATVTDQPQVLALRTTGMPHHCIVSKEKILIEQALDDQVRQLLLQCDTDVMSPVTKGVRLYKGMDKGLYARGVVNVAPNKDIQVDAIYVPKALRAQVIAGLHLSKWVNHSGYVHMCELVLHSYFWDTFRKDIREYIKTCSECQRSNPPRKKPIILDFDKPTRPGVKVAVDIIGPIITALDGQKYILTLIDMFSRHATLCSLRSLKAEEVLEALERYYITIYGVPEAIVSDRGSNFTAEVFAQACSVLQIKHHVISPYHPASNGMVERLNREIKKHLTYLCNSSRKAWANRLHLVQFALNNSFHSGINTSPNMITFGENRRFPKWGGSEAKPIFLGTPEKYIDQLRERLLEIRDVAWEHERAVCSERNNRLNRNRFVPSYEKGDRVLYRCVKRGKTRTKGFQFMYEGPFSILERISLVSYDIGLMGDTSDTSAKKRVHVDRLRPYFVPMCISEDNTGDNTLPSIAKIDDIRQPSIADTEVLPDTEVKAGQTPSLQDVTTGQDTPTLENTTLQRDEFLRHQGTESTTKDFQPPTHRYDTRSKRGARKKCFKNFHVPHCTCE